MGSMMNPSPAIGDDLERRSIGHDEPFPLYRIFYSIDLDQFSAMTNWRTRHSIDCFTNLICYVNST